MKIKPRVKPKLEPKVTIVMDDDGEWRGLGVKCGVFPIKKEVGKRERMAVLEAFLEFWKYIAEEQIAEIRLKEIVSGSREQRLQDFTEGLTKPQRIFINLLTKQNGWTPMKTVVAMFKEKKIGDSNAPPALKIAGTGSGLRRKEKKFGLKQIIEVQWNENKKEREYRLNPEYQDILKNILLEDKKI